MLDVLIVPAAGKSTRFPGTKPKWLLTHPDGRIMGAAALDGLPRAKDMVVVTSKEIAERFGEEPIRRAFLDGMERTPQRKLRLMVIKQTPHQPATVAAAVSTISSKRSICIKDTDNTFTVPAIAAGMNAIAAGSVQAQPLFQAKNKCYLDMCADGTLIHCAERQPIGDRFACGLYAFASAGEFMAALDGLWGKPDLYPSSVVNAMLNVGKAFTVWKAEAYEDWGTLPDWLRFRSTWRTIFVDVDGVLFQNGGQYFAPLWEDCAPIQANVDALKRLKATGRVQIILTSARPRSEEFRLKDALKRAGVPYHSLITDLFHGPRVLVNDYAPTNPYPTAEAINLVRNAPDLDAMLRGLAREF